MFRSLSVHTQRPRHSRQTDNLGHSRQAEHVAWAQATKCKYVALDQVFIL